MNEEEKDSVEKLNNTDLDINTIDSVDLHTYNYAVKTVLNLLQKQQTEIEQLKNMNSHQSKEIKKAVDYTFELNKEIEKKDKMINEMAPRVYLNKEEREEMKEYICKSNKPKDFSSFVKQYFERK